MKRVRKLLAKSKNRYVCPNCYARCWAKPHQMFVCGACLVDIEEIFFMKMDEDG